MSFAFGAYVLDVSRRELRQGGGIVPVEPQVFDLIHHLITERNRVVTKDELINAVWDGRIVSDSTLTSRINAARKAVGDCGRDQAFIRTYPRRGVRFVAQVREEPTRTGDVARVEADTTSAGHSRAGFGDKPVIAVLPFKNLTPGPEQDFLAESVRQDVVTALSWHRSLAVCSRDYAEGRLDSEIHYLLEGSVRTFGRRVRITAQLVETALGAHLWAERYDVTENDILEAQDEVTAKIAARIEAEVGVTERLRAERKPELALSATDYLQLGLRHFYRSSPADNLKAQQLFREAIAKDASLAQAYGFLSYAIVLGMVYHEAGPDEGLLEEAIRLARAAVALDERDAMIRFVYGRALLAQRQYAKALAAMNAAVELNPTLAVVYCGLGDSLAYESRFTEALPYFEKAIELSPHDPQRWAYMAYRSLAHLFAHEFEQAADWAQRATQVPGAHYWPYAHRVSALGHLDEPREVAAALCELQQLKPGFSCSFARERLFFVKDPAHLDTYVEGLRRAGLQE